MVSNLKVGLLFGGCSGEHDVSISSARAIASALTTGENLQKYTVTPFYIQKDGLWQSPAISQSVLDKGEALPGDGSGNRWAFPAEAAAMEVWFPILHGPNGEDGTIQGLLELMKVPYVGSGVLASAAGMDKISMKQIFADLNLPQVKYVAATREQVWSDPCVFTSLCDRIEAELGYPCFIKPANLGSSVGISKAKTRKELEEALDSAASYDRRLIIEAGVVAREVECAVLGNGKPKASVLGEISFNADFYDYETKYTAGQADLAIPSPVPEDVAQKIQEMAIEAFIGIDAAGLSRLDFFYVEATGEILINEINTLPGFTATSMYPQLWNATGIPFEGLVDQLIQFALERHQPAE